MPSKKIHFLAQEQEPKIISLVSKETGVMSNASEVLCLSVRNDPDYAPMLWRISSAIDSWKHGCALLAKNISEGLKLFLTKNWFIVNEWIIVNAPEIKWIYISWDWLERVVTFDTYDAVEKENVDELNLEDLPF